MRTIAALTLALLVGGGGAGLARAQDADAEVSFDAQLDAGLEHYQARRYAEAAAAFEAAYAIRPEPELAYNIARSYERAVMREEAIAAYDRLLELPGTTSEMRTRALSARSSLRAEIEALRPPEEPEPEPEPVVEPPDASAAVDVEPAPATPAPRASSPLVPVGWVLVGTGGLGAAVGGVFGGLALAANGDFEAADDRDEQIRLRDEVRRYALLTDILVGAGVGVAAIGVVLVILGLDAESQPVALRPVVGPDVVGLDAALRF